MRPSDVQADGMVSPQRRPMEPPTLRSLPATVDAVDSGEWAAVVRRRNVVSEVHLRRAVVRADGMVSPH